MNPVSQKYWHIRISFKLFQIKDGLVVLKTKWPLAINTCMKTYWTLLLTKYIGYFLFCTNSVACTYCCKLCFFKPGPKFVSFKELCDRGCFVYKNNTLEMIKSVNNKYKTQHAPDCFVLLQMKQISDINTCSFDSRMIYH